PTTTTSTSTITLFTRAGTRCDARHRDATVGAMEPGPELQIDDCLLVIVVLLVLVVIVIGRGARRSVPLRAPDVAIGIDEVQVVLQIHHDATLGNQLRVPRAAACAAGDTIDVAAADEVHVALFALHAEARDLLRARLHAAAVVVAIIIVVAVIIVVVVIL